MCSPGSNFLLLGAGLLAFFIIWFGFHGFGDHPFGARSPRKISWIGVGSFWLPSFALASQPASASGRAPSWPGSRLPCQGNSSIRRHVLDVLLWGSLSGWNCVRSNPHAFNLARTAPSPE